MPNTTIAIIGAGNMGGCIARGLVDDGYPADCLWVSNPSEEKLHQLANAYGINVTTDNKAAAKAAGVIILAVKPQIVGSVIDEIAELVQRIKPLVVSVACGVRSDRIVQRFGFDVSVVCSMPNTPCVVKAGATGLFANKFVSTEQRELAETIMRSLGITLWVDNEQTLDVVTALSGSGPAYFFRLMEALQAGGESLGLSSADAKLLTLQTALGASRLAIECSDSLQVLRQHVTSPGGATEAGIAVLEKAHIDAVFLDVLNAVKARATELSDAL